MRHILTVLVVVLLAIGAIGCDQKPDESGKAAFESGSVSEPAETSETTSDNPDPGPAKQLILLYTGDTLSTLVANDSYDPPEGGLPALTNSIASYLGEIAAYNRMRLEGEGRDASGLGVDFAARRVGEHPYILLDYGGWERSNDFAGEVYVALQSRMFKDLSYDAVGALLFERLAPITWEAYQATVPELTLLASGGKPLSTTLPIEPVVVREVHGDLWGLVLAPMAPEPAGTRREKVDLMSDHMQVVIDQAAELLTETHCRFSVLCAAGGTREIYERLALDQRFTVVLGVHGSAALEDGRGSMPQTGPLMLPELAPAGRELGVLHLYYEPDGEVPVQYYFSRKVVEDDPVQPWPYRKLLPDAQAEHEARLEEFISEQKRIVEEVTGHPIS